MKSGSNSSLTVFAELGRVVRSVVADAPQLVQDPDTLEQVLLLLEQETGALGALERVTLHGDTFAGCAIQPIAEGRSQTYAFSIAPDVMTYRLIDAEEVAAFAQTDEGWMAIAEFAAITKSGRASKKLNCKPGNIQCGGKCQSGKKNCFAGMTPAQKKAAQAAVKAARQSIATPPASVASPAPAAASSPIRTNPTELDAARARLVQRFGAKTIEAAEVNVQRILNDSDTNVYIRVGSSDTLERILGDRFKTAHELGRTQHDIPHLRDDYLAARARVEAKTLGYAPQANPSDRPIYGYLAGSDLAGGSHQGTTPYGSITIKLKPDVKARATFTGADSFKSGIASEVQSTGAPPPPNAASMVGLTRHGYDRATLPAHYPSYLKDDSQDGGMLRAAGRAKTIDDLTPKLAPTGSPYLEAQVHGGVKPSDIAEIRFNPKDLKDRPTPAIARLAKDNGIDLYIGDRKIDPDELLQPAAAVPPPRIQPLRTALDDALKSGDFTPLVPLVADLESRAASRTDNSPDRVTRQILADAGYDAPMRIGTAQDVTQAWKGGGTLLIRGMDDAGNVSARQKFEDLKRGDYYVAQSNLYGSGIYAAHCSHGASKAKTAADVASYNAQTAAADARDAWNSLTSRNQYISPATVNARMALDRTAALQTQSEAKAEFNRVRQAIDDWELAQRRRITAAASVTPSRPGGMSLSQARSEVEAELKQRHLANPKVTPDAPVGMRSTWSVTLPGRKGQSDLVLDSVRIEQDPFSVLVGGRMSYILADRNGRQLLDPVTRKPLEFTSRSAAARAAVAQYVEAEANTRASGTGAATTAAAANQIQQVADQARQLRRVLLDDARNGSETSGRLATIRGYDGIILNQSYEPGRFFNLLNRSRVLIQDDPMPYAQAQVRGD